MRNIPNLHPSGYRSISTLDRKNIWHWFRESLSITSAAFGLFVVGALLSMATNIKASFETSGRIGIRQAPSRLEFYDTLTSARFIPRGNNYIRLASVADPWGGTNFNHSLFMSAHFDEDRIRRALQAMADERYNVVRVFISELSAGSPIGGVDRNYVSNVGRFMQIAWQCRIRVLLTFWNIPRQGGYQLEHSFPSQIEGINASYLYGPLINAKKRFLKDFIGALKPLTPPAAIFAWEVENEAALMETERPLSLRSGTFVGANGRSYDLSEQSERDRLLDEGLVHWANELAGAVKEVDPEGLVAASFFSPLSVSGSDPRIVHTSPLMRDFKSGGTMLDFVDIHIYPGFYEMSRELSSFGIIKGGKPVIIGEMGVYLPGVTPNYQSTRSPAEALRALQILSCRKEFSVQGWITYTWDTVETKSGARDLFTAAIDDDGAINRALAPRRQKDPCAWSTAEATQ